MLLRLQITTPDGATRTFEHSSPVVRIGRDPASELALEGDNGRSVSWNHARIDLSLAGATIADLGSSNGTLLNDRPLTQPTSLQAGDRVQLGFTGAKFTVVQIDLAGYAPMGSGGASRSSARALRHSLTGGLIRWK